MKTRLAPVLTALLVVAAGVQAADFYVAPHGDDAHPGTETQPLATLQAAVNKLQPGDTLLIRGGTYRETVTFPRSGTADKPITLKAYRDEKVVVSGCELVTGWSLDDPAKRIWKAAMPWTLGLGRNQVFAGGQVLIEARHPNVPAPGLEMYVADLSPLWPTYGEFSIPRETRVSQPGRIVSRLLEGQPDDYWKGAMYCGVHFEGWCAQTGVIESSRPGEILVGDRTQGWWFGSAYDGRFPQEHEDGRGMIVGHRHALDAPGEWHWQDNTLYQLLRQRHEHGVQAPRSHGLCRHAAGAQPPVQRHAADARRRVSDGVLLQRRDAERPALAGGLQRDARLLRPVGAALEQTGHGVSRRGHMPRGRPSQPVLGGARFAAAGHVVQHVLRRCPRARQCVSRTVYAEQCGAAGRGFSGRPAVPVRARLCAAPRAAQVAAARQPAIRGGRVLVAIRRRPQNRRRADGPPGWRLVRLRLGGSRRGLALGCPAFCQ